MSKTIAPLISFGAGGQLGKTAVYASWKGIPYVRRYVIPANPRTTKQVTVRNLFKALQTMWLLMPAIGKGPFILNSQGKPYTPNNKFTSLNVSGVDTTTPPTDMSAFQGSPGAKGGLPPASMALTPGATTMTAAVVAPVIPTDWTISACQGICFKDFDPATPFVGSIQAQEDATSTYSLAFTGLDGTTDYVVSAWFEWIRPDGTFAYGTSLTDIDTTL